MKLHTFRSFAAGALLAAIPLAGQAQAARSFGSPDEAVAALAAAVNSLDTASLKTIFGPSFSEITSADTAQSQEELKEFSTVINQRRRVVNQSDNRAVLEVGENPWPFPVPLVRQDGRWFFDTPAGKEEIINRRIGRDELSALQTARAYVAAQREYAARDRDGDGVLEYAQQFRSTSGKKDGLYWPPELDGEISPLGPLVAAAQTKGYLKHAEETGTERVPFHGYYFKILTRQGKDTPGGQHDFMINGHMIAGFALVAYPAEYGESGIMTFIVNHQGRVYEKDLGPETLKLAGRMSAYNPDQTWALSKN